MKNKIVKRIVWGVVLVFLAMSLINAYIEFQWNKQVKETEAKYEAILQNAVQNNDVSLCRNHNFKLKCVSQFGIMAGNIGACGDFYSDELQIVTCKAIVDNDLSYCDEELDGLDTKTCKEAISMMEEGRQLI